MSPTARAIPEARSAWRDGLAGRHLRRPTARHPDITTATFEVNVLGFTVNAETWDDALQRDGKGDEVFVDYVVRLVDADGATQLEAHDRTAVMGDIKDQAGRVQAGTRSAGGGLQTGDTFGGPLATGRPNTTPLRVPFRAFAGELEAGRTGVVLVPSIWEHDTHRSILTDWSAAIAQAAPALGRLGQAIANAAGRPEIGRVIEEAGLALPVIIQHADAVMGTAESRPIGMVRQGEDLVFTPSVIGLNLETATMVARSDFGRGAGIIPLTFRDDAQLRGDYTLLVQVRQVAAATEQPGSVQL